MAEATPYEHLVSLLQAQGYAMRTTRRGVKVQCPVHGENRPSLDIDPMDCGNGCVVMICRSGGCENEDIVTRLGMNLRDLYNPKCDVHKRDETKARRQRAPRPRRPPRPKPAKAEKSCDHDLKHYKRVTEYAWRRLSGELAAKKVRTRCEICGDKSFFWLRPKATGGWEPGGLPEPLIYNLPQVATAIRDGHVIYVVEGEKDADNARKAGAVGTCNPDGAGTIKTLPKWRPEHGDYLKGANVIIVADRDEAGYAHAIAIRDDLREKAASIRIVHAAIDVPKADLSDHLEAGHDLDDLIEINPADELAKLIPADDTADEDMPEPPDANDEPPPEEIPEPPDDYDDMPDPDDEPGHSPDNIRQLRAVPAAIDGTSALAPAPAYADRSMSDDGNALRLLAVHGENIRYVPQRHAWLVWNGRRWEWDDANHVRELGKQVARDLSAGNNREARHRDYSLGARGTTNMLIQASSDARVVVHAHQLDAHLHLLNTPNGVVDLRTAEVHPPNRDGYHTRSTAVPSDDAMPTPRWDTFLNETFGGDTDMIAFVQRLAGYSASADVGMHVLPFLHGPGGNGKSVFLDVLRELLGDYATAAPHDFLMAGRQQHPTELASLQGQRLVICSEINQDAKFDEAKMKALTGGDRITARVMRGDFFSFPPTHHLWLMANHQPKVRAGGDSFWRRLRLVPFTRTVDPDKRVENLASSLVETEGPGILGWIVAGAVSVFAAGLREPEAVVAATKTYQVEEDHLARFLDERVHHNPKTGAHLKTESKAVRAAYEAWCLAEGEKALANNQFGRELKLLGIEKQKSNSRVFYLGVRLITDEEEPDDGERTGF